MHRVLLVDDEAIARRHLRRLLAPFGDIEVTGEASDGREAVTALRATTPDAVFLDVQMPGMDGFQVLRELPVQPLVVFTTAHDEHALAAFRENTIEYLLKPIAKDDVARAVRKLRSWAGGSNGRANGSGGGNGNEDVLTGLLRRLQPPAVGALLVPVGDVLRPVRFEDVVYLEARDKLTALFTAQSHVFEIAKSLVDLETRLPAAQFVRIHRRHVVNLSFVKELQRWGQRGLRMVLTTRSPGELIVSRRCMDDVMMRLGE